MFDSDEEAPFVVLTSPVMNQVHNLAAYIQVFLRDTVYPEHSD